MKSRLGPRVVREFSEPERPVVVAVYLLRNEKDTIARMLMEKSLAFRLQSTIVMVAGLKAEFG